MLLSLILSSCGGAPKSSEMIRVQTASTKVTPTNPSIKPTIASINWAADTGDSVGKKMLKSKYVAIATTRDRRVEMYAGKTYGRPSIVRLNYFPNKQLGKITIWTVNNRDVWKTYATLRQDLTRVYGPGVSVGEPKYKPNNMRLDLLFDQGKAPGTYWYFKKSGYTLALLIERPPTNPNEPITASVHIEPPDWDPDRANKNLGTAPKGAKPGAIIKNPGKPTLKVGP